MSPTQTLKQAMTKIAASSRLPVFPNRAGTILVSTTAPLAAPGKPSGQRSHVGQHGIDGQKHGAGDPAGPDRTLHHVLLPLHSHGTDIQGNDDAEDQGGNGVHGLVAVQEAFRHGICGIGRILGRSVALQRIYKTAYEGDHDQQDQNGAHDLAQAIRQLLRTERHPQGSGENTSE